jgi:hypothetical protein
VERWVLTGVWATLPLTAGGAVSDAVTGWAPAPRAVAAVLCWTAWAVVLLGVVVPRPLALTAARLVAPCFALVAIVIAVVGDVDTPSAAMAVVATLAAAVLAARPALALAAANASAYGSEQRFPLRVPTALFFGPLPAVRVLFGAAVASGPLLLADGQWLAGSIALATGAGIAAFAARSLHALSTRWVVLVPAGVVVMDPLTMADPVLFLRERIVSVRPLVGAVAPEGALDLRLGAVAGSVSIDLDEPAELFRSARARKGSVRVQASTICVAVVRAPAFLDEAARQRVPRSAVATRSMPTTRRDHAAKPPPTSSSPS